MLVFCMQEVLGQELRGMGTLSRAMRSSVAIVALRVGSMDATYPS